MKRIKEIFEKIQNLPRDKQIIVYGGLGVLLIPSVLISGMLGPKGLRVKFLEALFYCVEF